MDHLAQVARVELAVLVALLDRLVLTGPKVFKVSKDCKDLVYREFKDCKDLVYREFKVHKESKVVAFKESKEQMEVMVHKVFKEHRDYRDYKDLVHRASKELLVLMEAMGFKVP